VSTAEKISKWLKILAGIVCILFGGFEFVEALVHEHRSWRATSHIWTLADDPFQYMALLAMRALQFVGGLWLVFGAWDGGKSTK
jgi:cytochrome c biogenesis protein CcdA